jgi:replicative DNA helicase
VGQGVAYFSLDMSRESLVRRLISMVGKVDSQKMRLGYLSAHERQRVSLVASEIESLPIWIDTGSARASVVNTISSVIDTGAAARENVSRALGHRIVVCGVS